MSLLTTRSLGFGVALAVLSNVLFGIFYMYSPWLAPMTGTQVFVWRLIAMFFVMGIYLTVSGQYKIVLGDLIQVHRSRAWLTFLAPTPIMLSQLWLFMWAPVNHQGVAVAMGYFLFPLDGVGRGGDIQRAAGRLAKISRFLGSDWRKHRASARR